MVGGCERGGQRTVRFCRTLACILLRHWYHFQISWCRGLPGCCPVLRLQRCEPSWPSGLLGAQQLQVCEHGSAGGPADTLIPPIAVGPHLLLIGTHPLAAAETRDAVGPALVGSEGKWWWQWVWQQMLRCSCLRQLCPAMRFLDNHCPAMSPACECLPVCFSPSV